jgi:hypothetical protein
MSVFRESVVEKDLLKMSRHSVWGPRKQVIPFSLRSSELDDWIIAQIWLPLCN